MAYLLDAQKRYPEVILLNWSQSNSRSGVETVMYEICAWHQYSTNVIAQITKALREIDMQ